MGQQVSALEFSEYGAEERYSGRMGKAARKYGLYFGVSLHADHAWSWYEPSQRHDTKGPKKGIPYDGKLTKADGKGNGGKDMIRKICMHRIIH